MFHQRHALRPSDLSQALLDIEPQIVHFSGHGGGAEGLCLEEQDGQSHMVSSAVLSSLFREFSSTVECVVLNACYSEIQADAIGRHIGYVIGVSDEIDDRSAIAFGKGFYQALGAGKKIDEAYRLGCVQIGLESGDSNEGILPVLKSKRAKV
jgi:hypothetical protein